MNVRDLLPVNAVCIVYLRVMFFPSLGHPFSPSEIERAANNTHALARLATASQLVSDEVAKQTLKGQFACVTAAYGNALAFLCQCHVKLLPRLGNTYFIV